MRCSVGAPRIEESCSRSVPRTGEIVLSEEDAVRGERHVSSSSPIPCRSLPTELSRVSALDSASFRRVRLIGGDLMTARDALVL